MTECDHTDCETDALWQVTFRFDGEERHYCDQHYRTLDQGTQVMFQSVQRLDDD